MFDKHDKFTINFNELVNKNFKIDYKNFNETFDSYLARFITIVVLLNFSYNIQKIYFTKNLFNRLQKFCITVQKNLIFITLVERMRQINQRYRRVNKKKKLYQLNNFRRNIQRNNQSSISAQNRIFNRIFNCITNKFNSRENKNYIVRFRDWFKKLKNKIKNRKFYSDCLVVNYLHKNVDCFCKNKFSVLQNRAIVILKTFDIEFIELKLKQYFDFAETYIYNKKSDKNIDSNFENSKKI